MIRPDAAARRWAKHERMLREIRAKNEVFEIICDAIFDHGDDRDSWGQARAVLTRLREEGCVR